MAPVSPNAVSGGQWFFQLRVIGSGSLDYIGLFLFLAFFNSI